jgi:hypothetical protein
MHKDQSRDAINGESVHGIGNKALPTYRREQIRFPLRTPVIYHWTEFGGIQCQAIGWTRDISEAGTYVSSCRCPNEGDSVELKFRLLATRQQRAAEDGKELEMSGKVVRIDRTGSGGVNVGFAVRNSVPATAWQRSDPLERHWESQLGMAVGIN